MTTAEQALASAVANTGLSDFGAEGFREGLQVTLDAIEQLPLIPAAREATQKKIVDDLSNRLHIEHWHKQHPALHDSSIEGPILVCGLPRTGTTATVGMMARDDRFRFLRGWEASEPIPPPHIDTEHTGARAIKTRGTETAFSSKSSQHIRDVDGPQEDLVMLAGLNMHAFNGALPMPDDFLKWWQQANFASTYAYHRRVLQVLQSSRPPSLWLLKSPPHLFKLDAFANEYPNARFIMTHRDPAKLIASVSSLHFTLHSSRCLPDTLDKQSYGPRWLNFWSQGIQRALAARRRIGEHRFIDVWNDDLVAKPFATMARLYAQLGFEITPQLRTRLHEYNERNSRGTFGEHRYTPEEYGVTTEQIRAGFAEYIERFNL